MRTKRIFILILAVLAIGTVHGQQKINDMVAHVEKLSKNPPKGSFIMVSVTIHKGKDGVITNEQKNFAIKNCPDLVKQLIAVFDKERENAKTIQETLESYKIYRRYVFENEKQQVVGMLDGDENFMRFNYAYTKLPAAKRSPEEYFFRFQSNEDSLKGNRLDELATASVVQITREEPKTIVFSEKSPGEDIKPDVVRIVRE